MQERDIYQLPPICALTRTKPAPQACTLIGIKPATLGPLDNTPTKAQNHGEGPAKAFV